MRLLAGAFAVHNIVSCCGLARDHFRTVDVSNDPTIYCSFYYRVGTDASVVAFLIDGDQHSLPCCNRAFCTASIVFRHKDHCSPLLTGPCRPSSRSVAGRTLCGLARARVVELRTTPSVVVSNGCCRTLSFRYCVSNGHLATWPFW